MTPYEKLTERVMESDITLVQHNMKSIPAAALRQDKLCAIFINESSFETQAERREALAHEKSHCDTGTFYTEDTALTDIRRLENRAMKHMILTELPFDVLIDAFKHVQTLDDVSIYDVAEYLGWTPEFIESAIEIYKRMGLFPY